MSNREELKQAANRLHKGGLSYSEIVLALAEQFGESVSVSSVQRWTRTDEQTQQAKARARERHRERYATDPVYRAKFIERNERYRAELKRHVKQVLAKRKATQ